jgi:phosphogluconate dehydratase
LNAMEQVGMNKILEQVTARIIERSRANRTGYLELIKRQNEAGTNRHNLGCANLAHGFAATGEDKPIIRAGNAMNIGIISAYNDMLSAHQPYARYPEQIKLAAREKGATAQVAGGVPAMCDGVTQGYGGMELSLFSRDVIALATSIGLSHAMFEGALLLGICDKIVPGLLIGALRFGHLPMMLIPAGPMGSGLANKEKAKVRELYAQGKVDKDALLEAEAKAYHGAGTCTFYGTANSNQMMMEMMGLHMPGAAFIHPHSKLRQELTRAAVHRLTEMGSTGADYRPLGACIDEKAIVNAAVGLLATGGSTNHALHLPAIARAAGIIVDWSDLDALSHAVPLLCRIYPNGGADVNHFHAAGGMGFVIRELLGAGLLHGDILTVSSGGMESYAQVPVMEGESLVWQDAPRESLDTAVLGTVTTPFQADGGMRLVEGNLGRAIFKTSAVAQEHRSLEAPAMVFSSQEEVLAAFKAGTLDQDCIVVLRFQGPRANGMPELHKLTPPLSVLQGKGYKVALVTDGRMSGASGNVPAAIHVTPEALGGGLLAKVRNGDRIRLCGDTGRLELRGDMTEIEARTPATPPAFQAGLGRELFAFMRHSASGAEQGGGAILHDLGDENA